MSKEKLKNSIWYVLFEGFKIYFSNIDKFLVYMLFPVLGQVVGITLVFAMTLGLSDKIAQKVDSLSLAMVYIILLALPGLLIFAKAFWDFMVAYVALNSMTEGAVSTGHVYDLKSHNEVATRRTFKYILFLLVLSVLMSFGSTIFFIIPAFVLWIYFILIFQVFTFEPDLQIQDCYKRSFLLVRENWLRTFILMAILAFSTIYILTQGVTVVFDYLNISKPIISMFDVVGNSVPLEFVNKVLTYFKMPIITVNMISESIFISILSFIIAGLTLPIRSICWSLWYKNLSDYSEKKNIKQENSIRKTSRREKFENRGE